METWQQRPLRTENFRDGITAIEWTVEERGLAGLSDLEGIPWVMPMDQFFEAWAETVLSRVARRTGGLLKVGRTKQTTQTIEWQPSYLGSQRTLIPDLWLEWKDLTLIVDAKYKRHFEELEQHSWQRVEEAIREQHRNDLFQVLAYANLARTTDVVACLAYPCSMKTWESLRERRRLIHRASLSIDSRSLGLWLTALPMNAAVDDVAEALCCQLRGGRDL